MSKETAVITLGFLVIIIPSLGFPEAWRTAFLIMCGVGLIALGFYLRAEYMARRRKEGGGSSSCTENDRFVKSDPIFTARHEEIVRAEN